MNTGARRAAGERVRSRTSRSAALGLLVAGTLVTGCSLPHFADMSPRAKPSSKPAASATTAAKETPKPSPSATPTPAVPRGDLAAGSLTRLLNAGSRKLAITYWTSQDPNTWTAAEAVPVQLSAHIENGDGAHAVKVSRFLATLDDGSTIVTLADDQGQFVITPPFSYSSALMVRPANHSVTEATLSVEFDLLVETAPHSGQFFRQTVLDTVHLSFAKEANSK